MDQTDNSRWDGEEAGEACGNGCQQADNEPFDDGGLSIVAIPMSLSFIGYEAQNDSYWHGEQSAGTQGDEFSAEKHGVDDCGQDDNARVKAEELAKASSGNVSALMR
jgi:hypothetical protein